METIDSIIQKVQINIPLTMLYDSYLDTFIDNGLNPEIGLDAAALDRFSNADFKRKKNTPPIVTLVPHKEEALWPSLEYLTGTWPW